MNTIKKNTRVNAGWVIALLSLVFFSGFAQAQTVPKKTQPALKQTQVVPKPVQTSPIAPSFDHAKTGFLLRDIHTTLRCEQCHVDGIFKNTPRDCAGCHTIGSRIAATPKPVNHVQTTAACDTCHSSPTTFMVASFKHIGINSGCSSCHNGQSQGVVSKPANHFPTLRPCENCHNTTTFSVARMDHTGITTGCSSCHMGQFVGVVSKPALHITTSASCEACHPSTVTFMGAIYGHTASATGTCNTCHGVMQGVVGKPANHLVTVAQCDTCHTNTANYTTFLGAVYNHAGAAGICSTCHNGSVSGAPSKPATHISTALQCDNAGCHTQAATLSYKTFLGVVFDHSAVAMGGHTCAYCHNGSTAKGQPAGHIPTSGADCGGACHTTTSFLGVTYTHVTATVANQCSTCHGGSYPGVVSKPANHTLTSSQCDVCHTETNTGTYTHFSGAGYDHAAAGVGSCTTCHGVSAIGKPAGHIPTTTSCDGCHNKPPVALTFFPGKMDHTLPAYSGLRCDSCHNGSYTSQGAQPKVSNHIPTTITGAGDCKTGGCHNITLTVNSSAMSWTTESMNHNGATGGGPIYCVTCHLSGTSYLGSMQKKSHEGASTAKDCSRSSCHKPLGSKGISYSTWK